MADRFFLVGEEGLEPSWDCSRWHLKPVCLPFHHSPKDGYVVRGALYVGFFSRLTNLRTYGPIDLPIDLPISISNQSSRTNLRWLRIYQKGDRCGSRLPC